MTSEIKETGSGDSLPIKANDSTEDSGGIGISGDEDEREISHVRYTSNSTSSEDDSKNDAGKHKAGDVGWLRPIGDNLSGDMSGLGTDLNLNKNDNVTMRDKTHQDQHVGDLSSLYPDVQDTTKQTSMFIGDFSLDEHPLPCIIQVVNSTLKMLGAIGPMIKSVHRDPILQVWNNYGMSGSWDQMILDYHDEDFRIGYLNFTEDSVYEVILGLAPDQRTHPVPFALVWTFKEGSDCSFDRYDRQPRYFGYGTARHRYVCQGSIQEVMDHLLRLCQDLYFARDGEIPQGPEG
jgi:hypothetical protein